MKRVLIVLALFTLLQIKGLELVDSNYNLNGIKFRNVEDLDLVNNIRNDESESRENEKGFNIKNFYGKDHSLCEDSVEKYKSLIKSIDNYVTRYKHEIKDSNEMINVDLEISITGEDLAFLQEYAKSESVLTYPHNLSKLNRIFSKIAREKERNFLKGAMESSKWLFFRLFYHPSLHNFVPFLIIALVTWIIFHFSSNKSLYIYICIIINSMILWDSYIAYQKKLKEVDLEIHVKRLQLKGIPKECEPENLWWYNSMRNYFFGDPCLQYYKELSKISTEEVSFFKCIVDTYAYYLVQSVFRVFGSSVKEFTGEIAEGLPSPFNKIFYASALPFYAIFLGIFIFVLLGKRLKISFFGSSVEVGDVRLFAPAPEKITFSAHNAPKAVRDIKKLRPWTKGRISRRMDVDSNRRKKLWLKAIQDYRANNTTERTDGSLQNESI